MKKIAAALFSLMLLLSISTVAFAHGGGTDAKGGHYDHYEGEYHYHHGYPAHDHEDGKCPYVKGKNESKSDEQAEFGFFGSLLVGVFVGWLGGAMLFTLLLIVLGLFFHDWFQEHLEKIQLICSILVGVVTFICLYFFM